MSSKEPTLADFINKLKADPSRAPAEIANVGEILNTATREQIQELCGIISTQIPDGPFKQAWMDNVEKRNTKANRRQAEAENGVPREEVRKIDEMIKAGDREAMACKVFQHKAMQALQAGMIINPDPAKIGKFRPGANPYELLGTVDQSEAWTKRVAARYDETFGRGGGKLDKSKNEKAKKK